MDYSIKEMTELTGVSSRTLRYYDEIGLLKPKYSNESGYRFYGEEEIDRLQQILFYRRRGLPLKTIRRIMADPDFDARQALAEHLCELKKQRSQLDDLITTVEKTLLAQKGDCKMSNREKFEAFKKDRAEQNEAAYGAEIRAKYGDVEVNDANREMLNMTEDEYNDMQNIEARLKETLIRAVKNLAAPDSEAGRKAAELHKKWLMMTWPHYSAAAHKGLAEMYLADERFKAYYNNIIPGGTQFLCDAIRHWI